MWDNAVVTNAGTSLLALWASGGTLNITGADAGEGVVSSYLLMAQTSLADQKQSMSIIKATEVEQGIRFQLQLTSAGITTAYTLNQIGIWANIGENSAVLLAIFQDETGISIPTEADMPDFVFTFYATVQMSNVGEFSVSIDASAIVTSEELANAIEEHDQSEDAHADLFSGKQNTLTFDATPTTGSSNPVTSNGIKTAISAITKSSLGAAGKSSKFAATLYAANWGADCLNLFDEVWGLGAISTSTGADISSTTVIRSVNYIAVSELSSYRLSADKTISIRVFFYDASNVFLSSLVYSLVTSGVTITTPASAAKIRMQISSAEITYFRWFMVNSGIITKSWEPRDLGYHLKVSDYSGLSGMTSLTNIVLELPELASITTEQLEALQGAKIVPCYQDSTGVVVVATRVVPTIDIPIVVDVKGDAY